MAFVNEKDVPFYDDDGKLIRVKSRTIDHERNIVLERGSGIHGSGRPPAPELNDPIKDNFILKGDDFQIRIEAHQTYTENESNEHDLFWKIHRCWDAEGVEGREEEIKDLIVEAINTYGVYFGKKNVNSIAVTFGEYCSAITKDNEIAPIVTFERDF